MNKALANLPVILWVWTSVATWLPNALAQDVVATGPGDAAAIERAATDSEQLMWHTDYAEAWRIASAEHKNLLIVFHDDQDSPLRRAFETETLGHSRVKQHLPTYVRLKLPVSATTTVDGHDVRLLSHTAFQDMQGRAGIAIVDLSHPGRPYFGRVVSEFPFDPGRYHSWSQTATMLSLPAGTLTQRTMVYAVRIHPEAPQSGWGQFDPHLADEAQSHSFHQASITLQGHHNWDSRFQRINSTLPGGLLAQEVVAESWPGKTLVDACIDCVDSWRQSPGHWNAVRSRHPLFGFDIQRGRNGIWYATGIFGRR